MNFYRVKFHYFCLPAHHENYVTLYYRAVDEDDVVRRFPILPPCAVCPPDAAPHGKLETDWAIEEISAMAFELSDGCLEPDIQ